MGRSGGGDVWSEEELEERWRSWQKFRKRYIAPPDENRFISQNRILSDGGNWVSSQIWAGREARRGGLVRLVETGEASVYNQLRILHLPPGRSRKDSEWKQSGMMEWKSCPPASARKMSTIWSQIWTDWDCPVSLSYLDTGQSSQLTGRSGSQPDLVSTTSKAESFGSRKTECWSSEFIWVSLSVRWTRAQLCGKVC